MWHKLAEAGRLKLSLQLCCGQSFRWQPTGNHQWTSVLDDEFIISLRQLEGEGTVEYCVHGECNHQEDRVRQRLEDYFQLQVDLDKLYADWSAKDKNFARCLLQGHNRQLRILRMEPWDALLSFICSSNNNISRITQMVQKLSQYFGRPLGQAHGLEFRSLPTAQALIGQEQRLRDLGFGYRAKYLTRTAQQLIELASGVEDGSVPGYLQQMRSWPYQQCREQLIQLTGVGPKIADCVCLFGLDKGEVVPVDTHVRTIAQRDYGWRGKTDEAIQQAFHRHYGPFAGWAHCVLFAADLKSTSSGGSGDGAIAVSSKDAMEHGEVPAVEANENDKENVAKGGNSTAAAELKRRKRRRRT